MLTVNMSACRQFVVIVLLLMLVNCHVLFSSSETVFDGILVPSFLIRTSGCCVHVCRVTVTIEYFNTDGEVEEGH